MATRTGFTTGGGEYFIDENEPVMVLRGKDVTCLAAICAYVQALLDMNENEVVNSHLDSSLERLRVFWEYQTTSGVAGGQSLEQLVSTVVTTAEDRTVFYLHQAEQKHAAAEVLSMFLRGGDGVGGGGGWTRPPPVTT